VRAVPGEQDLDGAWRHYLQTVWGLLQRYGGCFFCPYNPARTDQASGAREAAQETLDEEHLSEAATRDDKGELLAKAIGTFKLLADREKKNG
jgi:hypothetical protein